MTPRPVGPIEDYVALTIPAGVSDDEQITWLAGQLAELPETILAQYGDRRPKAIVMAPVDWLITTDPAQVERHQPAHDCEQCRAGNDAARAFLEANPGGRVACGNLRYIEVW